MDPTHIHGPVWACVAHLERLSMDAWRNEHAPTDTMGDAFAQLAVHVETTVRRRPGGNISVTVSILGRKMRHHKLDYFTLQRTEKDHYEMRTSIYG